jgi:hypothetical protein
MHPLLLVTISPSVVVKDEKDKTLEDVKCTVVNDKGA